MRSDSEMSGYVVKHKMSDALLCTSKNGDLCFCMNILVISVSECMILK